MKRRLYTLDVFTTKQYAGNPLAVVTDGDGISQAKMQAIAREMNLSETVFVQRPTNNRALARLRIFTTTRELPLAGHPVIGTWFLLAELGVVPASEGHVQVWQQTGAGILPVEFTFHDGRPVRVTMTQKPARFVPAKLNRAALAEALGLKAADLDPKLPLEFASTGISNLMVPLRGRSVLPKIHMNMRALAQLISRHGVVAYCFALGDRGKAFARGMLPWGLVEDPATGSAGGSLGAYLVQHDRLRPSEKLTIMQGIEMGRPSEIQVEITSVRGRLIPKVSGSAVRVLEGHIEA
ncbi:MAG TPA: PhzF family phenazine biosynthesis protein [Candidatus Acidoferrales bacterium]|jgi:trans-2,3-dihydro-3-hydroxyanthranilate isomerase|nr:PhzF family phenazine biosynthesis protein [Candidatus Acidoferrales bacterium]